MSIAIGLNDFWWCGEVGKAVGSMVLRHRVLTTYEAEAEGVDSEAVLRTVFDTVPVP